MVLQRIKSHWSNSLFYSNRPTKFFFYVNLRVQWQCVIHDNSDVNFYVTSIRISLFLQKHHVHFESNTNRLISFMIFFSFNDLAFQGSLITSTFIVYNLTRMLIRSFVNCTARFTLAIQLPVITATVQLDLLYRLSHVVIKCYAMASLIMRCCMKYHIRTQLEL